MPCNIDVEAPASPPQTTSIYHETRYIMALAQMRTASLLTVRAFRGSIRLYGADAWTIAGAEVDEIAIDVPGT